MFYLEILVQQLLY